MEVELKDATGRVVAVARAGRRFVGHENRIWAVEYSPDGTRLASTSMDNTVRVWDRRNGKVLLVLRGHEFGVYSVSHSPDGARLASASRDRTVRVWDSRTGEALLVLRGHEWKVESVSYSPDGVRLASASVDKTVRVWDSRTGQALHVLSGHEGEVSRVSHSPDGARLASASSDTTVRVWDSRTGQALHVLQGHESTVLGVSYSPDGARLASASSDTTVRVWDSRTGQGIVVLRGHEKVVWNVSYSPDGARLASASEDKTVRVWDAATGCCLAVLPGVNRVAWSPDGTSLVARAPEDTKVLVEWTFNEIAATRPRPLQQLAARQARTVGRAPPAPRMPDPWVPQIAEADDNCLGVLCHDQPGEDNSAEGLAFSADGRTFYIGGGNGHVDAWDLETGTRHWTSRERHDGAVLDLSLSLDGIRLASGSTDKTVRVWDSRTGEALLVLRGHEDTVHSVSHSPNGAHLASSSDDKTVRVWDSRTGHALLVLGHEDWVRSVNFSPDGAHLASASDDKTVRVWDSQTGQTLFVLRGHEDMVNSVSYSPDGTRLASASNDKMVRVWDSRTGHALLILTGHEHWVETMSYSPDGTRLASASHDKTVRVWDAATGACLQVWDSPEDYAWRVIWSPTGAFLASSHDGGVVRLWDARAFLPDTVAATTQPHPLPRELARLPPLAAALLRHRGHALALATLRDVHRLLQSRPVQGLAATLQTHRNLAPLQALRWPPDALAALVLLLCAHAHDPAFAPPPETTPTDLHSALSSALVSGTPVPEDIFTTPAWTAIRDVLDHLDPARLLTLLHALGPAACAAHPHILLTLADRLPALIPLTAPARELLATTTHLDRREGPVHSPLGLLPAGTRPTGPPWTLRPWQWALPQDAFDYRLVQHLLVHADRRGAEPPRLRPTVLILDDSIESRPTEHILRAAALLLATSLLRHRIPAYLLTAASRRATPLSHPTHLADILAPHHHDPVDPALTLARAHDLARSLTQTANAVGDPVILLLTHVYFAADEDRLTPSPALRAMFVRYPHYAFTPAHLHRYPRHAILGPTDLPAVPDTLAELLR